MMAEKPNCRFLTKAYFRKFKWVNVKKNILPTVDYSNQKWVNPSSSNCNTGTWPSGRVSVCALTQRNTVCCPLASQYQGYRSEHLKKSMCADLNVTYILFLVNVLLVLLQLNHLPPVINSYNIWSRQQSRKKWVQSEYDVTSF